jgi:hypothetical protein
MLEELLPSPVLSVGLTGHRNVATDGEAAEAIERGIGAVLEALQRALTPAVAQEAAFFAGAAPVMRLITMGAEGADLLGMRAAAKCEIKISTVVPFPWNEYRNDFSASAAAAAAEISSRTDSVLELPGRRDEGTRAYERANDIILSNIDLLLAVWSGGRARGRAGTGDVVQAAVVKDIPIIVIDPQSPSAPTILVAAPVDDFEPPVASDLARRSLPTDLIDFVHGIVSPPPRQVLRQGLIDLLAETPRSARWRFEYPLLLKTAGGKRIAGRKPALRSTKTDSTKSDSAKTERAPDEGVAAAAAAHNKQLGVLDQKRKTIDGLAVQYGQLFRSSSVSQYLIVILGAWTSGVIGLLVPSLAGASIVVQLLANALVVADASFRGRHRWQERWLDYRVVAERLRWLGFRYTVGLGAGRQTQFAMRRRKSWIDWYMQRTAHALGPPRGKIDAASIAAAADHLSDVEIPEQIAYHRATFRRLGQLERRLSYAAHVALWASFGVGILLIVAAIRAGGLQAVGVKPLALVLLAVLPGTMTSLNGLRVDADLVRLVERSEQTIALLFRVRRIILAAPRDYDHVAANMQQLAAIMRTELEEWRFVIESRRSRAGRRRVKRKRNLLRVISDLWKRPGAPNSDAAGDSTPDAR